MPSSIQRPWQWQRLTRSAGAALAVLLLAGIAILAYQSIAAFERSARAVTRSHEVQLEIEEFRSLATRLRVQWRLYIAGGQPRHLDNFQRDTAGMLQGLDNLQRLTAGDPEHQQRVAGLRARMQADLAELSALAHARSTGALQAPEALLAVLARERPAVEQVASVSQAMQVDEARRREARERDVGARARLTKAAIVGGNLAALALLGAALWLLARENRERLQAQRAAQRHAREVEDLYNHAPCGYHSVDADGRIVRMNDTWLAWLGYGRDEVVGRMRHPDLMTEDSARHYREAAFPLFKQQGWLKEVEFEYRRKDGTTFPASLSATVVADADGNYAASRSVVFDITERKRIEAQLLAANRELESFSYSVSHDLRAPLRAVNGYAQMLEEDWGPRMDDEGRRLLATIRDGAGRMGRLIDDLLAFSRLGRQAIVTAGVDMTELARQATQDLAAGYPAAQVDIGALPAASGDRALLRQVWANLVGNALKYSAKADAPRVEVGGRIEGGECAYWVRDNGAGFDMRYYNKLFGVFQRLHGEAEFAGTGVGLAIVQRIVTRHGGRVWAQGEPGRGATFHFTLPSGGDRHG